MLNKCLTFDFQSGTVEIKTTYCGAVSACLVATVLYCASVQDKHRYYLLTFMFHSREGSVKFPCYENDQLGIYVIYQKVVGYLFSLQLASVVLQLLGSTP